MAGKISFRPGAPPLFAIENLWARRLWLARGAGVHLAVNVDATTEWLEPVSDEQYGGGPS